MPLYRNLLIVLLLASLTSCVTNRTERFYYNHSTGECVKEWMDLRSRKDVNEDDYSVEKDWEYLKEMALSTDSDYKESVVESVGRELYQDGDFLSGRMRFKVRCPDCFPGKVDVLKHLCADEDDYRFESHEGDIFLFLPKKRTVISSNGKIVESENSWLIVWPEETTEFEFVIRGKVSGGTSLLPNFLEDKDLNPSE